MIHRHFLYKHKSHLTQGGFYCSTSKSSERKISSSKKSVRGILKPLASIITVLKVTVLFRPFIIHCILPCCIPDSCSKRYWDISFSRNNLEIRFATASFTVKLIPPPIRRFNFRRFTYIYILPRNLKNIRRCTYILLIFSGKYDIICRCTYIKGGIGL